MFEELKSEFELFYSFDRNFEDNVIFVFRSKKDTYEKGTLTIQLPSNAKGEFDFVFLGITSESYPVWAKNIVERSKELSERALKGYRLENLFEDNQTK